MDKKQLRKFNQELNSIKWTDENSVVKDGYTLNLLCHLEDGPISLQEAEKKLDETYAKFFSGHDPQKLIKIYKDFGIVKENEGQLELTERGEMLMDSYLLEPEKIKEKYQ